MSVSNQTGVDRFFLQLACVEADKSPDPSTRNGAVMVCAERHPAEPPRYCKDCNRFSTVPQAAQDADPEIVKSLVAGSRDLRLAWIEHAETNALFTAVRRGYPISGGTLYCPFAACTTCARAITLLGVSRLVRLPAAAFDGWPERWRSAIVIADQIMLGAGVEVDDYSGPPLNRTYWLDGKEWSL